MTRHTSLGVDIFLLARDSDQNVALRGIPDGGRDGPSSSAKEAEQGRRPPLIRRLERAGTRDAAESKPRKTGSSFDLGVQGVLALGRRVSASGLEDSADGIVQGSAFDAGHGTLAPRVIADEFWAPYASAPATLGARVELPSTPRQ
jgi:hypothetical protein